MWLLSFDAYSTHWTCHTDRRSIHGRLTGKVEANRYWLIGQWHIPGKLSPKTRHNHYDPASHDTDIIYKLNIHYYAIKSYGHIVGESQSQCWRYIQEYNPWWTTSTQRQVQSRESLPQWKRHFFLRCFDDFMLVEVRRPVPKPEQDFPEDTRNHRWGITLLVND